MLFCQDRRQAEQGFAGMADYAPNGVEERKAQAIAWGAEQIPDKVGRFSAESRL